MSGKTSKANQSHSSMSKPKTILLRILVFFIIGAAAFALLFHVNPGESYLWIKSVHVIAVISWMAGMLYLPRLFIYHTQVKTGSEASELFKVMEYRLMRYIINPAMIVSWITGLWMAYFIFNFQGGWLHAKIGLVVILSGVHGYLSASMRKFSEDRNQKSTKYWRFINEVPTLLMIFIVILVIVKPF